MNPLLKSYDYVKDEMEILKKLSCKYIVKTFEIIETPSNVYIVMEYMQKNSLTNYIQNLDVNEIWRYFRNLISALEYCKRNLKIFF